MNKLEKILIGALMIGSAAGLYSCCNSRSDHVKIGELHGLPRDSTGTYILYMVPEQKDTSEMFYIKIGEIIQDSSHVEKE